MNTSTLTTTIFPLFLIMLLTAFTGVSAVDWVKGETLGLAGSIIPR